jgi:hypothetical protein
VSTEPLSQKEYCAAFLIDFLRSVGVVQAELSFSGGGDDGDVNDVVFSYRNDRAPTTSQVSKKWNLAAARHFLLYPEHNLNALGVEGSGGVSIEDLVKGFFFSFVSESLGDWVNNDGGAGTMEVRIKERIIGYTCSYNSSRDSETQEGLVQSPDLLRSLLAVSTQVGVASIRADLRFDSDGGIWNHDVTYANGVGDEMALEAPQEAILFTGAWNAMLAAGLIGEDTPVFSSADAMVEAIYEQLVEGKADDVTATENDGYRIGFSIVTDAELGPVLRWDGDYSYMDCDDDGDGGEIEAPRISSGAGRTAQEAA